jgi:transcriptional regulator with XRE-family HTH domain
MTKVFEVLDSRGIKRIWLAKQLGISPSHLNRLEKGERPFTQQMREKVSQVLQVPVDMLFFDAELGAPNTNDVASNPSVN